MWPYHPELLATPVPRYTSYPTAAEFGPIGADAHAEALSSISGDVSLYVHIPFCERICFYCGCNTGRSGQRHRLESYLTALLAEIDTVSALLPADAVVRRIAFGGGSPNALAPSQFLRLVDHLTACFTVSDPVFSIELDPRSLTAEWAEAIGAVGIQRASLGVQTFAPQCQAKIGRIQPDAVIERGTALLRAEGVTSLNFDLMYGLPGQRQPDLRDTLDKTAALRPDRVALFGYAHVPRLIPRQRVIDEADLPDMAARFEQAQLGHACLVEAGYVPVGFDHFALPGDALTRSSAMGSLRRNFQGFTDDQSEALIGVGSSAISSFPHLLVQNEKNSGRYRMAASAGRLAGSGGVIRSPQDRMRGRIIESLLCQGSAYIPPSLWEAVADSIEPYLAARLVEMHAGRLRVNSGGLPYARVIAALFDANRQQSIRRFSAAV